MLSTHLQIVIPATAAVQSHRTSSSRLTLALAMTWFARDMASHSRGAICVRVMHRTALGIARGHREGRASTDTRGPRAEKNARGGHHRFGRNPAFPAQWCYGLYVLSPGTGLSCPRRRADRTRTTWPQRREARTTRFRRPRSRHSSAQGLRADVTASIASRFQRP
jgi:hypothetical protein